MSESPFLSALVSATHIAEEQFAKGYVAHAHRGQTYSQGLPYTFHLEAVAETVKALGGEHETVLAAHLHDIIEDTDIGPMDLLAAGFPHRTVELVLAVTKTEGDHRPHATWIAEIIAEGDAEAILLKLADTMVNLATSEALPDTDPHKARRLRKYAPAKLALTEALEASRTER